MMHVHVYIVDQDLIQTDHGKGGGVLILFCEMIRHNHLPPFPRIRLNI